MIENYKQNDTQNRLLHQRRVLFRKHFRRITNQVTNVVKQTVKPVRDIVRKSTKIVSQSYT